MPRYALKELAETLGLELRGEDACIEGINTLEAAGPDEISFFSNPRYADFLKKTRACAVIVDSGHAALVRRALVSDNPYRDFGRALALFARREGCLDGISTQAFIHPEASLDADCIVYPFVFVGARARIGKNCTLFPGVYIGEDAVLGDHCQVYPNAVVLSRVEIGDNCLLHAGAVIGSEGFGFTRVSGGIQKIPQAGFVKLGSGVEIGANSTVDRGALGPTFIGDNTKMDNQVQIGHNAVIGAENLVVAQVGVAGSAKTGHGVTLAAQAGISGHLSIGDNALIGPRAGVAKDVPAGFRGGGTPLVDGQTFLRTLGIMPKLPNIYKRFLKLEKEMEEIRKKLSDN